jgi:agarase
MAEASITRWGGLKNSHSSIPGFFRVSTVDGVFWLVDPDGGRFLSKGVTTVRFDQDCVQNTDRVPYAEACQVKYANIEEWRSAAAQRLRAYGFNSLGAWSDELVACAGPLPLGLAPVLHLGSAFLADRRHGATALGQDIFPDVFDPEFNRFVRERARTICSQWRNDVHVIGWFTDNELRWGADWRGDDELLMVFLRAPAQSFGRSAALATLRRRYGQIDDFNEVWRSTAKSWADLEHAESVAAPFGKPDLAIAADRRRQAFEADCELFAGRLAERYFQTTVAAVRAADPNHLVLGCRFAQVPRPAVLVEAAACLDVISLNCYEADPRQTLAAYATAHKPLLIGEFSFRGDDSGLPNSRGGGPRVATQGDRSRAFQQYVAAAMGQKEIVGYHWFEHADQPAEGRFDGENSNYGLVSIDDDVYETLAAAMHESNSRADAMHAAAAEVAYLGSSVIPAGERSAPTAPLDRG